MTIVIAVLIGETSEDPVEHQVISVKFISLSSFPY